MHTNLISCDARMCPLDALCFRVGRLSVLADGLRRHDKDTTVVLYEVRFKQPFFCLISSTLVEVSSISVDRVSPWAATSFVYRHLVLIII